MAKKVGIRLGASKWCVVLVVSRRGRWGVVWGVQLFLVGALSNILVFLGEEREWLRVDKEGENEPR